ncbi:MAG: FixH family protein [Alphaproteobacteria bacterium]
MSNRKFSLVTAILLLLLIAATANMFIVYHAFNRSLEEQTSPSETGTHMPFYSNQPLDTGPAVATGKQSAYFDWNGDLTLAKSPAGGYDIVVMVTIRRTETPVPADSVEMDASRPGEAGITPELKQLAPGKYVAHVDFPETGEWEIRLRIHRGLQTIEFAKKFTIQ